MEQRKCFCNGSRGTDCDYCQGTGYIVESIYLNTSKPKPIEKKETKDVKSQSVLKVGSIVQNITTNVTNFRLFEVAKKLNVDRVTLLKHLKDKGFRIYGGTNPRLTEMMYFALQVEFAKFRATKPRFTRKTLKNEISPKSSKKQSANENDITNNKFKTLERSNNSKKGKPKPKFIICNKCGLRIKEENKQNHRRECESNKKIHLMQIKSKTI